MARKPIQFNWRRHWKKKVEPHLHKPVVQKALDLGMIMLNSEWKTGDPPHELGAMAFSSSGRARRIVKGKLSWYQPLNRCHWLVYFSFVLGKLNYPHLRWEIVTGDLHTVAVGFDEAGDPEIVMDILLYDEFSAEESIRLTHRKVQGAQPSNMDECFKYFVAHCSALQVTAA
jgi:hypothetical protein